MTSPDNVTPIKSKITRQTDLETGERREVLVEEEAEPAKRKRKRARDRKVFSLIDNDVVSRLELTSLQWRIVFIVMAEANRDKGIQSEKGIARITGAEIAAAVGSTQPSVARAMTDLVARNIIFKLAYGKYRVTSHLAYRGEVRDWDEATERDPMPVLERTGETHD